jgi:phytoene dehydrogenase-like protein
VSRRPQLELRIPSLLDPHLAATGKHVMTIDVQYAPYHLRDGSWDDGARNALGDHVLDTLADYAPGIRDTVLGRRVTTPLDLERRYDLPEGSVYHGEMTLDQILFMRPVAGSGKQRTPVEGLYLCGPGAHPGGGIAGGAGALAAREAIKRRREIKDAPVRTAPRTSNLEART